MNRSRPWLFGAASWAAFLATRAALANDPAAAQVLFEDAKKLAADGRWAAACPKLEESQRLDPGMGTAFHLASCHEHVGRTATAWAEYLDVAASARAAGQVEREKAARDRAAALATSLSRMKLAVARDVPGLVVTRDGAEVGRAQWGLPLPVDPGSRVIVARAPGKKSWEMTVTLASGGRTVDVLVPELVDDPAVGASASLGLAPSAAAAGDPLLPAASDRGQGHQRVAGIALAALGFAGVGVGAGFGLASKSKHDDARSHCDGANHCDADGLGLREDALRDGTIATVAFAAGGAALVTGAIVWLTAPGGTKRTERLQASPQAGGGTTGITLSGSF